MGIYIHYELTLNHRISISSNESPLIHHISISSMYHYLFLLQGFRVQVRSQPSSNQMLRLVDNERYLTGTGVFITRERFWYHRLPTRDPARCQYPKTALSLVSSVESTYEGRRYYRNINMLWHELRRNAHSLSRSKLLLVILRFKVFH
jgi:hypothetical protein